MRTRCVGRRAQRGPGPERLRGEAGQASIELLALAPLLTAITLAVLAFLAAHTAAEAADQAAVAAAVAKLQGTDVTDAAKAASPGWSKAKVRVSTRGISVQIAPRAPRFIARLVDAERTVALP